MRRLTMHVLPEDPGCWWTLLALCSGSLLITINTTIVHVAIPSIKMDLGFSESSLVWVVNAYLATFGGFLLIGGRLGDVFGHRRMFLSGILAFTFACLACGIATTSVLLVIARAAQGVLGSIVWATALSQINNLFLFADGPKKRARALGIYAFVSAAGGSCGLLLGGVLTSTMTWRWAFFASVPMGLLVYAICIGLIPRDPWKKTQERPDVLGAAIITASLVVAVFAIVNAARLGWVSGGTLVLVLCSGALLIYFARIEARAQRPLVPLALFRTRSLALASFLSAMFSAAVLTWRFTSALYLQLVQQFDPLEVAFLFLPADVTIAVMSMLVSPVIVQRYGLREPLAVGMLAAGLGLVLLARAPVRADVLHDVVPGMLLLGLGYGMSYSALLQSALTDVPASDSGAASGIVNTSFTMGGVLGLSAITSISAAWTASSLASGMELSLARSRGYGVAFGIAAILAASSAFICMMFLRKDQQRPAILKASAKEHHCDDAP